MTCPHCKAWQRNQETDTQEYETVVLLCDKCHKPFVYSWTITEKTEKIHESDHRLTEDEVEMISGQS